MPDEGSRRVDALISALRMSQETRPALIGGRYGVSELEDVFDALGRLESYEQFVSGARQVKSATQSTSVAFESLVLDRADQAARDCEVAVGKMLAIHKSIHVSGYLNALIGRLGGALEESGPLTIAGLVEFGSRHEVDSLLKRQIPLPAEAIDRILSIATRQSLEIGVTAESLEVRTPNGPAARIRLPTSTKRRAKKGRRITDVTITDVLYGHPFDLPLARIGRQDFGGVDFVEPPDNDAPPRVWTVEELLFAIPINAQLEMRRHVNKIRQVGLPAYEGNEGVIVLAVIVLAIVAIAWLIDYLCDGSEECEEGLYFVLFLALMLFPKDNSNQMHPFPAGTTFPNPSPS